MTQGDLMIIVFGALGIGLVVIGGYFDPLARAERKSRRQR